ncbi:hypothetical protein EDC96DRAFT_585004 [Choanephora cucurbitarum]|nr:hypothetical protein EDC96DRAFT_585004 [Choanephora cucurbitarum]
MKCGERVLSKKFSTHWAQHVNQATVVSLQEKFHSTEQLSDTMSIESCGVEEGADRASPPMDLNSPMNETPLDFGESYDMSVNDIIVDALVAKDNANNHARHIFDTPVYDNVKRQYVLFKNEIDVEGEGYAFDSVSHPKNLRFHEIFGKGKATQNMINELLTCSASRARTFSKEECIFNPLLIDVCQECRFAIRDDDTMVCPLCNNQRLEESGKPYATHQQLEVAPQLASLFLNKSFINQPDNFGINCLSRLFKGDYLNQMIERINFLNGAHNLAVALFFDGFNHNQFEENLIDVATIPKTKNLHSYLWYMSRELEELQIEGMVVRVGVAQYHQATYRTSLAACAQFVLIDSIRLCVHA